MHEYSILEDMLDQLLKQLRKEGVERVKEVHLRIGTTMSEGPLRQAFQMLTENTILAGSDLIIEEVVIEHTCGSCSNSQIVTKQDLIGHIFICPKCGAGEDINEGSWLKIIKVTAESAVAD